MLTSSLSEFDVEAVSSDFSKHETAVFLLFGLRPIINPIADNFCDPDDAAIPILHFCVSFFGLEQPWLTRKKFKLYYTQTQQN